MPGITARLHGMNKSAVRFLAIAAVVLLLGACRINIDIQPDVSNWTATTSWWTAPEQYVVCDNRNTTFYFTFRMADTDDLIRVRQTYVGQNTDEFDTIVTTPANQATISGNTVTVSYTFGPSTAPLGSQGDLETSAIVVVPTDPNAQVGTTQANFQVVTRTATYNFPTAVGSYSFPVWGPCTDP